MTMQRLYSRHFLNAAIVSNNAKLTDMLSRELNSSGCEVVIFSSNVEEMISQKLKIEVIDFSNKEVLKSPLANNINYVICLMIGNNICEDMISFTRTISKNNKCKTLLVYSYEPYDDGHVNTINKVTKNKSVLAGIIYVGEIYLKNKLIGNKGPFERVITKLEQGGKDVELLSKQQNFYFIEVKRLISEIVKTLFSMKAYGKKVAIISDPISARSIARKLKKKSEDINIRYKVRNLELKYPFTDDKVIVKEDVERVVTSIISKSRLKKVKRKDRNYKIDKINFIVTPENKLINNRKNTQQLIKRTKKYSKKLLLIILFAFLVPVVSIVMSYCALSVSNNLFLRGNIKSAESANNLAMSSSRISYQSSHLFRNIPFLGYIFNDIKTFSTITMHVSRSSAAIYRLVQTSNEIIVNAFGDDLYDIDYYTDNMYFDLEGLDKNIALLISEMNASSDYINKLTLKMMGGVNPYLLNERIGSLKQFAKGLSDMLGKSGNKKYALVIQNDSILKPVGGDIIGFIIFEIHKGRVVKIDLYGDEYTNKDIQGDIEVPAAIEKYSSYDEWKLREAGWDPDFRKSAEKIEWFIDKLTNNKVNGLIALNTSLIKYLSGNSKMADDEFQRSIENTINSKDGSEHINNLIKEMLKEKNLERLFVQTSASLSDKDTQVFVNDTKLQREFSELGWSGGTWNIDCSTPCVKELVHVVEANMNGYAVNGIKRELQLSISFEEGVIKSKLIYYMSNTDSKEKDYNVYLRLITDSNTSFRPVYQISQDIKEQLDFETEGFRGYKSIGTYISIPYGQVKAVVFEWELTGISDYEDINELVLLLRKQSGIDRYPMEIMIDTNEEVNKLIKTDFILTEEGKYLYNTSLSRDFISRILLK